MWYYMTSWPSKVFDSVVHLCPTTWRLEDYYAKYMHVRCPIGVTLSNKAYVLHRKAANSNPVEFWAPEPASSSSVHQKFPYLKPTVLLCMVYQLFSNNYTVSLLYSGTEWLPWWQQSSHLCIACTLCGRLWTMWYMPGESILSFTTWDYKLGFDFSVTSA